MTNICKMQLKSFATLIPDPPYPFSSEVGIVSNPSLDDLSEIMPVVSRDLINKRFTLVIYGRRKIISLDWNTLLQPNVAWESISPTNLCNVQKWWHKVKGVKDAVLFHWHLFWKFTAYFRLKLFHWALYFGIILPNAVALKSIKNSCAKPALLWHH